MKICAACDEELPKESFSKKQWQLKQHQRRCKDCIDVNRDIQLKNAQRRTPCADAGGAGNEHECWICLEGGVDELGKALVRDCSCRGDSGFAHLRCIIKYAEQKSIMCVESGINGVVSPDIVSPWATCPNCKQFHMKKIAPELTAAFLTFLETNYSKDEEIYISALHWKLEVLSELGNTEGAKQIASKVLSKVRQLKMTHSSPSKKILGFEAYAHSQLARIYDDMGTKESRKIARKHYETSPDIFSSVGLIDIVADIDETLAQHDGIHQNAECVMEKRLLDYTVYLESEGKDAPSSIRLGILLASLLYHANRVIEAERLISNIARGSNRVHGAEHELTKEAESLLRYYKKRYVSWRGPLASWRGPLAPKSFPPVFQALRYENDAKQCIVYGPAERTRDWSGWGMVEESSITFDTHEVNIAVGTPVICQGLMTENHLNGKVGDLRFQDLEKTGQYTIHFEDKSLKPCLIKPENVRILFELPDK